MGDIHVPAPVLFILAVSSRYEAALEWTRERCTQHQGPVIFSSDPFDFTETDYYTPTMGTRLKKQFLAFERLIDSSALASIKRETNEWEVEYAALGQHAESRPLNLDPGYLTPAKLVLASTKDHAHRIYLREGIFAEVTLVYRERKWQPLEWTYPDFRRDDYQRFLRQCRDWLLNCGDVGGRVK